jgi:uncharacterized protein YdaU (DUF1376 family)
VSKKQSSKFESPWWYRQVPRDFMSSPDVQLMTAEECGSFFFLLQWSWLGGEDCTLPNDPTRLAKLARVERVSDLVLGKFETDSKGRLYNARLTEEWQIAQKRSKDAKKALSKRWNKESGSNTTVEPPNYGSDTTVLGSNYGSDTTKTKTKTKTNKKLKTVLSHTEAGPATSVASDSATPETPNPGPSESGRKVAAKLAQILGRDNLKPGTQTEWAEQADKLISAHGEQVVLDVMRHHLVDSTDGFWRGRVLAMKNFARCFTTMHKQSKSKMAGTARSADPLAQRAASLQTGHDFTALAKGDL